MPEEKRLPTRYAVYPLKGGDRFQLDTPGGGGLANPDWYLNAGDVIECEIEKIGTLVNAVVNEPRPGLVHNK